MSNQSKKWIPDPHQVYCVNRGIKGSLGLLLDPGLGKTSILLEIFNQLKRQNKTKGALVIAPKFPCQLTWPDEIEGWSNFKHLKYTIFKHKWQRINKRRKVDIYLINPEKIDWLFNEVLRTVPKENWPFDTLIVDESAKFKHISSARTKVLLKNLEPFKYRYIANGTPTGNGFLQLFSQMFIVDKGKALGKKQSTYMDDHFIRIGKPEWKNYQLASSKEEKKIVKKISKSAVCLIAEDHVEMPKRLIRTKYIEIPPAALKIYTDIETELYSILDNGDELVAESAASLATMLHQICSGAVYNPQDPLMEYQPPLKRGYSIVHEEKVQLLAELIEELNGKQLLVGFNFQSDREVLKKHFGNKITFFNGKNIEKIQKDWNSGKIKILGGQMQSIGFGLNLQKNGAHHIAIYTPTADFETFDQFTRRLYRRGNKAESVYIHMLLAKGLYDDVNVYQSLQNRDKKHISFFESMKQYRLKREKS